MKHRFILDKHHAIEAGCVFAVCGNTWRMLRDTRFAPYFEFIGDFSRRQGSWGMPRSSSTQVVW